VAKSRVDGHIRITGFHVFVSQLSVYLLLLSFSNVSNDFLRLPTFLSLTLNIFELRIRKQIGEHEIKSWAKKIDFLVFTKH